MGSRIPDQRHLRFENSINSIGSSSSSSSSSTTNNGNNKNNSKKKWWNLMPLLVGLVVIAEIAFLGRLDVAKNVDLVNSWADSFYQFTTSSSWLPSSSSTTTITTTYINDGNGDDEAELTTLTGRPVDPRSSSEAENTCEEWLKKEDSVAYSRDFEKDPIFVTGAPQEWKSCPVGCKFGFDGNRKPDAAFGLLRPDGTSSVLRSMESSQYYAENNIATARRRGYDIIMTTSLSSDVPVGYFSWSEYDIMAPLQPKVESALAAAFISNCGAHNFRLQALEGLERENIKIDSYGSCHRNRGGNVDKLNTLTRYKFSLAFENSNEEDYVTEKFFQSLVAGSVPIVVGAPNIQEFAPSPCSLLHIKELKDVDLVAKTIKYLAENPGAYNESLRWKFEGPSDSFKALIDMAAVHSSCRLCIYLATKVQEKEEKKMEFQRRPCKCTRGLETVYHVYVRERGRFEMVSIFLRSSNLTLETLEFMVLSKFKSVKHVPVWKQERPQKIRGDDELKVYRMYPLGMTQRQALYTFRFSGDAEFRNHIESNLCAKFEVIFV